MDLGSVCTSMWVPFWQANLCIVGNVLCCIFINLLIKNNYMAPFASFLDTVPQRVFWEVPLCVCWGPSPFLTFADDLLIVSKDFLHSLYDAPHPFCDRGSDVF